MAKKTYAEVKEQLASQKDEAKQAKKDLSKFCKENKLEADKEHPDNKKWVKLKALAEKTAKAVEDSEKWLEENKEKKESTPRASKYEYPADVTTAADKKKFRAQARAAANKKTKGEGEGTSKKEKKAEKAEKTEKVKEGGKKKDKSGKKEKKEAAVAAED
jgi:hypothetical protein